MTSDDKFVFMYAREGVIELTNGSVVCLYFNMQAKILLSKN